MLFLVGLGLSDKDLSMKGVEILAKSEVYIDNFTSYIPQARIDFIERTSGKKAKLLERSDLEEDAKSIVERARNRDVAILTGGDPLMATTHKILFIEAQKLGVKFETVHATAIIAAAMGESGLDFYRFGQVCTIPAWSEHYSPTSFFEVIKRNLREGLHSLVLLDYDFKRSRSLEISTAVDTLVKSAFGIGSDFVREDTKIIVMHNVDMDDPTVLYTTIGRARKLHFDSGPTLIIVPAEMSSIEQEAVMAMCRVEI